MKVLFAVSTENIVDSIIKAYQKKYKEIISSKNVYYYNAIIKELQRNQTYDRIVISEDLEPFTNNNYDAIDKFIFEKLDNISDEAIDSEGRDIPIIVICSERREKSDDLLVKLFSMGVYDALIGQDRKIEDVCKLLNKPRTKKEAKIYYKIEQGEYEHENDNNVSEVEIQNILNHFRKISKNEEKYVESFDRLVDQYNTEQLKIIIKFLPIEVKAVLEAESPKYQSIMMNNGGNTGKSLSVQKELQKSSIKVEKIIDRNTKKMNGPIVIPSTIKKSGVKKLRISDTDSDEDKELKINRKPSYEEEKINNRRFEEDEELEEPEIEGFDELEEPEVRDFEDEQLEEPEIEAFEDDEPEESEAEEYDEDTKDEEEPVEDELIDDEPEIEEKEEKQEEVPVKRGRGRPRKIVTEPQEVKPKRGRGRPRKNPLPEEVVEENLPQFEEDDEEDTQLPGFDEEDKDTQIPGFDEEEIENYLPEDEEEIDNQDEEKTENYLPEDGEEYDNQDEPEYDNPPIMKNTYKNSPQRNLNYENRLQVSEEEEGKKVDISHLITQDKKIVAFVGTSKNGVSFLVNNLADILSSRGINTALVDLTRNKNSYYIFTENKDELREIAYNSMESLKNGETLGIQVNRNLTVFTSSPNIRNSNYSIETMLTTLVKNYSLILLDCDYTTSREYFRSAQEIYLVQSMDVLTIQPLTEFLRKLKLNEVLDVSKLRAVINKAQRVRGLNENMIVGGMSTYNDPEMSIQDKLFDMKSIQTTVVPFDMDAYQNYLSQIANCEISTKGYNKAFTNCLNGLADQVYPVVYGNRKKNKKSFNNYNNYNNYERPNMQFSNNMNDTLSKMKNQYK